MFSLQQPTAAPGRHSAANLQTGEAPAGAAQSGWSGLFATHAKRETVQC